MNPFIYLFKCLLNSLYSLVLKLPRQTENNIPVVHSVSYLLKWTQHNRRWILLLDLMFSYQIYSNINLNVQSKFAYIFSDWTRKSWKVLLFTDKVFDQLGLCQVTAPGMQKECIGPTELHNWFCNKWTLHYGNPAWTIPLQPPLFYRKLDTCLLQQTDLFYNMINFVKN